MLRAWEDINMAISVGVSFDNDENKYEFGAVYYECWRVRDERGEPLRDENGQLTGELGAELFTFGMCEYSMNAQTQKRTIASWRHYNVNQVRGVEWLDQNGDPAPTLTIQTATRFRISQRLSDDARNDLKYSLKFRVKHDDLLSHLRRSLSRVIAPARALPPPFDRATLTPIVIDLYYMLKQATPFGAELTVDENNASVRRVRRRTTFFGGLSDRISDYFAS